MGVLRPADGCLTENPYVAVGLEGTGERGSGDRRNQPFQAGGCVRSRVPGRGAHAAAPVMARTPKALAATSSWIVGLRLGLERLSGAPPVPEDTDFWHNDPTPTRDCAATQATWPAGIVDGQTVPAEFPARDDATFPHRFLKPFAFPQYRCEVVNGLGIATPSRPVSRPSCPSCASKATTDMSVAVSHSWDARLRWQTDKPEALPAELWRIRGGAERNCYARDGSAEHTGAAAIGAGSETARHMSMLFGCLTGVDLSFTDCSRDRAPTVRTHTSGEVATTASQAQCHLIPPTDPQAWLGHANTQDRPWRAGQYPWRTADPDR